MYPRGQRGLTVDQLLNAAVVRIHPRPSKQDMKQIIKLDLVTFCEAEYKDIDNISKIEIDAFPYSCWTKKEFKDVFFSKSKKYGTIFKLVLKEHLVGYAVAGVFTYGDGTFGRGYISKIAIVPAHRKRGLGRFLMKKILSFLRNEGAIACDLDVRESNTNAQKLYESLGFIHYSNREDVYTNKENSRIYLLKF